ncbi:MAG: flagellar biosynthetic protein FliO [Myxococcota bacterium]
MTPLLPEPEIPKSELPELAGGDELNLGWTLVRTMLVLGMVIALVYLTLNVGLRKLLGIRPTAGTSMVTVLERVPLDQRRSLFVVEAAGEVLLIGGSDNSLTLLSKLDRAEVDRLRAARASGQPVQLSPFLQKLLGRKDAPPPPAT